MQNITLNKWAIRIYFLLAALQGFLVLFMLVRIPGEAGSSAIWGFSIGRFTLIVGVSLITLAFLWLTLKAFRDTVWLQKNISRLNAWLERNNNWGITIGILALCVIGGSFFILLGIDVFEPFTRAYFVRLQPFVFWLAGLSGQSLILLPLVRYGTDYPKLKPRSNVLLTAVPIFGLFILVWVWVGWTRTGLEAEAVGWNTLGSPILETQVLIAWVIAIVFLMLSPKIESGLKRLPWPKKPSDPYLKFDIIASILIWLAAIIIWYSIPLTSSWFVSPARPPNYEVYPNSDAILYDTTAQSMLVGEGFKSWGTPYASRPMYALFLAILHKINGLEYEPIIFLQVALLAVFPVLLYWMSRLVYNRLSGVIVAVLVTLREANAIRLNEVITVSHSKLIMADLPTAVGVALFAVFVIAWLQKPEHRKSLTLAAGGILGLFMLVRPEVGVQLLFAGLIIFLIFFRQPAKWFFSGVLLAAGVLLVLAPWIWRNWQIDGKVFIDQPNFRADLFAKRYSENPEETSIKVKPDETYKEYSERMTENTLEFAQEQPKRVGQFILSHYMNSQIQTVLVLPTTFRLIDSGIEFIGHKSTPRLWDDCCSVSGYTRRLPFWFKWDGVLPYQSYIPILINLLLIALGFSTAWYNSRLIGLLPVALLTGHLLINAAVRNSGGRYILPVDWVGIFYFSIGLAHVTLRGFKYFTGKKTPELVIRETTVVDGSERFNQDQTHWLSQTKTFLIIGVGLLLIGSFLPVAERAISPRYPAEITSAQILSLLQQDGTSIDPEISASLEAMLDGNGLILNGRALYPRFHPSDVGEPGEWRSFQPRPYPRVSFYLVGPDNIGVILPTNEAPDYFPHGTDVVVIGCYGDRYFDAIGIIIWNSMKQSIESGLIRSPLDGSTCPLPSLE